MCARIVVAQQRGPLSLTTRDATVQAEEGRHAGRERAPIAGRPSGTSGAHTAARPPLVFLRRPLCKSFIFFLCRLSRELAAAPKEIARCLP
jgi:hypothetical protein